jgi:hypothetical protein
MANRTLIAAVATLSWIDKKAQIPVDDRSGEGHQSSAHHCRHDGRSAPGNPRLQWSSASGQLRFDAGRQEVVKESCDSPESCLLAFFAGDRVVG